MKKKERDAGAIHLSSKTQKAHTCPYLRMEVGKGFNFMQMSSDMQERQPVSNQLLWYWFACEMESQVSHFIPTL